MNFIGRQEELKRIERLVNRDELNVALIYGRRRVGKSELVKQVLKSRTEKCIYYECKQVAEATNAMGLGEIISENLGLPPLGYTDMEAMLKFAFERGVNEKMVLVLDEYPYLRESVKGIDSILQSLIDAYKDESHLTIILLGSYVEVMRGLLEHANPLYGRVDLTINLKQMDYYDSSLFYSNYCEEDKVRIYSVFGGIPYYNRLVDDTLSVEENIIELIASPGARLENEVSMYLNSEIGKIKNANEVFEALSKGFSKYKDILSQSHVSSGSTLVDVLDKLIGMEVVEKVSPINAENNRKRMGYMISDNLSLFYYRYIFRYSSQLKIMNPNVFYKKYIEKDFEESYVPHQFEIMCKQYLVKLNKLGAINPVLERIGKYYYDNPTEHRNGEFDVVTEDEKGYAFYEVKFREKPITDAVVEEEIAQVEATGLNCYKYVFISRSGFNCQPRDNTCLIELEKLYNLDSIVDETC